MLFLGVFAGVITMVAQSGLLEEKRRVGRVQATYLNHLINFTHWDKDDLPPGDNPAQILILGDEGYGLTESLRFLSEQSQLKIGENNVEVLQFGSSEKKVAITALKNKPQVVMLLSPSTFKIDEIKQITPNSLLIGDYKEFVSEHGGDIAFLLEKNRVRLIINEMAFKRKSPKLSSQISTLRNVVELIP